MADAKRSRLTVERTAWETWAVVDSITGEKFYETSARRKAEGVAEFLRDDCYTARGLAARPLPEMLEPLIQDDDREWAMSHQEEIRDA